MNNTTNDSSDRNFSDMVHRAKLIGSIVVRDETLHIENDSSRLREIIYLLISCIDEI